MEAHASALGGIANSHQRCSDSAIPQPKLSFVSLIAATPPHTLSQLLFQLRCRGKKEEAAPREAQRQHDFSFASWGEEEAAPREAQHSMISASPHGGKKEAAARFLVGGNDGSSRISFGWNRKLASKMLKQCDSAAKAAICFAYRCNASSHALAAAISASLQGGKEEATPHGLSTGMISAMLYEKGKSAAFFFQKHKTAETLPYFTCSSPETAAACFTGFG